MKCPICDSDNGCKPIGNIKTSRYKRMLFAVDWRDIYRLTCYEYLPAVHKILARAERRRQTKPRVIKNPPKSASPHNTQEDT